MKNIYNAQSFNLPRIFSSDSLPLKLGSPLKVPSYSWENWGITYSNKNEFDELVRLSEEEYRREWDLTTEKGHKDIALTATKAGLGDANKRLNEKVAEIIKKLLELNFYKEKINILDVGAGEGSTSVNIIENLNDNNKKNVFLSLLDPAKDSLNEAKDKLTTLGIEEQKSFKLVYGTDLELKNFFDLNSQDIVVIVAALHHHAHLQNPLNKISKVLRKGGFLIIGDWHNSMWEHPNRVYRMLKEMQWENKDIDLENFTKLYPEAKINIRDPEKQEEIIANQQIMKFWKNYSELNVEPNNQFFVLEGHRPARKYVIEMENAGFCTTSERVNKLMKMNPLPLLANSALLCVTIGEKSG